MEINASIAKVDVVKFDGTGNFGLWQRRVKETWLQGDDAFVLAPDILRTLGYNPALGERDSGI